MPPTGRYRRKEAPDGGAIMLVMSRRLGEELGVGDVSVQVVALNGDQVRLGVTAKPNVVVYRPEQCIPDEPGRGGSGPALRPRQGPAWEALTASRFEELIFR